MIKFELSSVKKLWSKVNSDFFFVQYSWYAKQHTFLTSHSHFLAKLTIYDFISLYLKMFTACREISPLCNRET